MAGIPPPTPIFIRRNEVSCPRLSRAPQAVTAPPALSHAEAAESPFPFVWDQIFMGQTRIQGKALMEWVWGQQTCHSSGVGDTAATVPNSGMWLFLRHGKWGWA